MRVFNEFALASRVQGGTARPEASGGAPTATFRGDPTTPQLLSRPPLAPEPIVVWIRPSSVRLVGALTLVALAAGAEAGGARVRWSPSPDPRVTGYHVYMRDVGAPYATAFDAGKPAPASDGNLSYTLSSLTTAPTHFFAVTAYTSTNLESGISGEIALGPSNPCAVDHCSTPTSCDIHLAADGSSCDDGLFCNGIAVCQGGVCRNGAAPSCSDGVTCTTDSCDEALARCVHVSQPGCCRSDADCLDNDACTTEERCTSGTCVSLAAICPPSACADAFCDPQSGCGLMPVPDGVSCVDTCDTLTPRRFVLHYDPAGVSFSLRATFQTYALIYPTITGFAFEVADAAGAIVYRATIPGASIGDKKGKKFTYIARSDDDALATDGLSGMVLKVRHGKWSLKVRGIASELAAAMTQPQLALAIRFDTACARDTSLLCEGDPERSACR